MGAGLFGCGNNISACQAEGGDICGHPEGGGACRGRRHSVALGEAPIGLKQSPRMWNMTIDKVLQEIGSLGSSQNTGYMWWVKGMRGYSWRCMWMTC